jgi:S-(hydroxymethyl)glutathione dehydrogenase / alcohol dehydrogenase
MKAAVLRSIGQEELEILDVDTAPVTEGLVKVSIKATGVCHSDLSVMNGTIPQPPPCVLGHEGAGEIIEVGPGVRNLSVGDRVIVVWVPVCGECQYCLRGTPNLCMAGLMQYSGPRFLLDGAPVGGMAGTGTFAEEVVLPHQAVIKVPDDTPYEIASLIGCGVMTGVGAAINTAKVRPGSSVVVYGLGGVGISVIQGA